jgi:3-hydroxyisobutyrate dehydrogenase-like beta-hydroxyacid dehydrogenase
MPPVRDAWRRQRTFDRLYDRFLPNKYAPPSFALKLGHKDMRLATELDRELGVPMRLANMAFAEMTQALRGWENRDSRWRDRKVRPGLAAHAAPFLWVLPGR